MLSQAPQTPSGVSHPPSQARHASQSGMHSPSAGYANRSPRAGGGSSGAPLSSPLAHLEQATSNLGASFDRR